MKRLTSKEVLAESFREIAEHKQIDKITIKDITENCGYSSATFYRQFKDKYDLIAWDYSREFYRIISNVNGRKEEWVNALKSVADFFQERKIYLANLFLHTGGLESFIAYMQDVHFQCVMDIMKKGSGDQSVDSLSEMYIRMYVLGTVQFTCEWILGKIKITAEELALVYERTLPVPLQKYLQ